MRLLTAVLVLFAPIAAAADDPRPAPKAGGKASPPDAVEGYKLHKIEGFNLLVSKEVLEADTSRFERKPLDVLERELTTIREKMTPQALATLRKLTIWVEWDEKLAVGNGRDGSAIAIYYGGHQFGLPRVGKQPVKSKSVTILRMKSLTAEHQPGNDKGRCVLLHEIAHAVEDNLLTPEQHVSVKAAYRQAMERKLYDKAQYVSTNEMEFFAELTCAYFDQLQYFPHNREELKKHDPASFRVLDSVWGVAARKPDAAATTAAKKPKELTATNGSDKFDLTVKLADVLIGEVVHGPPLAAGDLAGKVVLLGFWGGEESAVLGRLAAVHEELAPYGLRVVVGPGYITEPEKVKAELAHRDVPFTGLDRLLVPVKGMNKAVSEKPPHVMLLDPDGTCVFRGSGYDVLPHARAAVGRALLAKLDREEFPAGLAPVADALTHGRRPLLEVLATLPPLTGSKDSDTAADTKALLAMLTAPGQEALDEAQRLRKNDPVAAFLLAEPLPERFKGSPIETKARALVASLNQTDAVIGEMKARNLLKEVKKLDAALSGQAGSFNPTDPRFQAKNATTMAEMKKRLDQMRKLHPKAKATEQAEKIAKLYGIR
jgi:hypothetical protein